MSNSNNNNSRVPKLRFPGFIGEWEEKKMEFIFVPLINSTLSRSELNSVIGKAMYVHYGDVLIKFGDVLDLLKVQLPFISDDLLAERACRSTLKNGDVIMADTAEDETVGKCTEIKNVGGIPVISGLHTIPLRPSIKFAVGFLGYYFNSPSYRNGLYPLMQGVKVTSISRNAIMGTKMQYPSNFVEQQKIAECLTEMDNLISAQAQKVELLKTHKKGVMQQLFPQPGETTPQLRFPGFTGEWEEKKLGEVFERINNGASYNTYLTEGFPMSRIETISTGKIDYSHVGYSDIKPDSKYKLEVGDILFSHINSESRIGRIAKYNGEHPLYHGMNLLLLRASESNNKDFVYYQMDREEMRKQIQRFAKKAINQASVSTADLKRVTAMFPPTHIEQKKIAECLSESDKTIEAESAKLEALKAHKKGLMQQLFPEPIK